MAAGGLATAVTGRVLDQERDFFGVLKVTETPDGKAHRLFHGSTLHGQQSLVPDLRRDPLTYYSRTGPVGDIFRELPARREGRAARVAVAGMGVGTLAAYAAPGDRWTFFELDPAVVRIARDARYFTYVSDCPAKSLDVVLGDARLGLARTPDSGFDLILLDAFSSDSIPVHLITREALGIYRRKLAPGGWLVFNITNRYLDLASVLALLADDAGLACRVRVDHRPSPVEAATGLTGSDWAVLATSEADLGALGTNAHWLTPSPITGDRVWTDDFSNIFTHFFMRKIDA
jgi:SAM-dependent methyltransferase